MNRRDFRLFDPSEMWEMESGERHRSLAAMTRWTIVLLFVKVRNTKGKWKTECLSIPMQNLHMLLEWLFCQFLSTHLPCSGSSGHNGAIVILENGVIR